MVLNDCVGKKSNSGSLRLERGEHIVRKLLYPVLPWSDKRQMSYVFSRLSRSTFTLQTYIFFKFGVSVRGWEISKVS